MTAADGVVFTVVGPTGTYTISAAEHAHWAEIAHRSGTPRRDALWQAFEQLVHFTWLEAEAVERGLALSDEVVQRELVATRRDTFPDEGAFQRFLQETGQTAADFEQRVRQHLLSEAIRANVMAGVAASVTDAMVEDYIAEHGLEQVPERRDVRLVLTERKATALTAKRELLRGTSWESVVARYSIDEDTRLPRRRAPAGRAREAAAAPGPSDLPRGLRGDHRPRPDAIRVLGVQRRAHRARASTLAGSVAPDRAAAPRQAGGTGRARPVRGRLQREVEASHDLRSGIPREPALRRGDPIVAPATRERRRRPMTGW